MSLATIVLRCVSISFTLRKYMHKGLSFQAGGATRERVGLYDRGLAAELRFASTKGIKS